MNMLSTILALVFSAASPTVPLPASVSEPCAQEDSVNCYWDAGSMGNGGGHSFITREMPGPKHMVCVLYIDPADAKKWDYCA